MAKALKTILFATNLQEYSQVAFDVAASMATHYDARIILLHVVEQESSMVSANMSWLFNEEELEKIAQSKMNEIQEKLIGKNVTNTVIRSALEKYCAKVGKDENSCVFPEREIIIAEGDVVSEIIHYATEFDCAMIVMPAHEGLFRATAISSNIRGVLKKSMIPVTVVPEKFANLK